MRATVNPDLKHSVDGVLPGKEGDFVDNLATRALVSAGVLRPRDELPPEPPPKPSKAPLVGPEGGEGLRAEFSAAWERREAQVRAERDRAAEAHAAVAAERDRLAAEVAQLRADLDAVRSAAAPKGKAKKGEEQPPAEKAEG